MKGFQFFWAANIESFFQDAHRDRPTLHRMCFTDTDSRRNRHRTELHPAIFASISTDTRPSRLGVAALMIDDGSIDDGSWRSKQHSLIKKSKQGAIKSRLKKRAEIFAKKPDSCVDQFWMSWIIHLQSNVGSDFRKLKVVSATSYFSPKLIFCFN